MKFRYIFPFALLISFCSLSFTPGDNKPFPKISGTTLNGKKINLPEHSKGKMCLVAMASSLKAQNDLNGWVDPIYKSIAGNIMIPAEMFFIPMTGGIKGISQVEIEKQLKANIDTALYKYVMIYSGPPADYTKQLNMTDKDKPYFFVVNPRGEITYTTSGAYSDAKLEQITDKLGE
jgi:hypothetical protein